MKGILRVRNLLYLLPLMVFFCQKTNDPWGFCVGNNEGFINPNEDVGAGNNFALGARCPDDFPYPANPIGT